MEIRLSHLSQYVGEGFFRIKEKREEIIKVFELNNKENVVFDGISLNYDKELNRIQMTNDTKKRETLYELIVNSWESFEKQGMTNKQIRKKIEVKFERYFENIFCQNQKYKENSLKQAELMSIIPKETQKIIGEALDSIKDLVDLSKDRYIAYGLILHIVNVIERGKTGRIKLPSNKIAIMKEQSSLEYEAASNLKDYLEQKTGQHLPDEEVLYLTMFLQAIKARKDNKKIGILVIAHGDAAASTMADVANKMLGVEHVQSIDMPLNEKIESVLEKAIQKTKEINEGKGVLLLVDMGSLIEFGQIITEKTKIPTKCLAMVNTPMVIEATRKAFIPNMDLEELLKSIDDINKYAYSKLENSNRMMDLKDNSFLLDALVDILNKTLTFLDAKKCCTILQEILNKTLQDINQTVDNDLLIKFIFHCSCMIERLIRCEPLPYNQLKVMCEQRKRIFNILKKNFLLAEEVFGVEVCETEIAYVAEIFDTHFDIHH